MEVTFCFILPAALATRTREQEDHKSVMMELSKQVQQYEAKMTELRGEQVPFIFMIRCCSMKFSMNSNNQTLSILNNSLCMNKIITIITISAISQVFS